MGLVLVLLLITYYSTVLKCLSVSFYIGCGSAEPVACPSILLPPVLNGEGRNGSRFI